MGRDALLRTGTCTITKLVVQQTTLEVNNIEKTEIAVSRSKEESAFGDTTTLAQNQEGVKKRGLFGSFGMLLKEQWSQWPWYLVLIFGALGAGGKCAANFAGLEYH